MEKEKEKEVVKRYSWKCLACLYGWVGRKDPPPVVCPRCKSYKWHGGWKASDPKENVSNEKE